VERQAGNSLNNDLLVAWKDIAAYLKCSVRKAQRLEKRDLPVHRIAGTKSIWASKAEIDRWLTLQAETAPDVHANTRPPRVRITRRAALWLLGILVGLTVVAAITSAYGLTIVFFGTTAVFAVLVYPSFRDSSFVPTLVAFFVIAAMSYCSSATTLPDLVGSVVNMTTLRPAFAYPFVAGLRFIPIPILIGIMLFCLALGDLGFSHKPHLRHAYFLLGLLLLTAAMAGVIASGVNRIWQAGLSIRWTLLAGECFILSVNAALFLFGYHFFNKTSPNYRQLLSWSGIAFLLIALTAAIVNRHWNEINKYYLDVRYPQPYRVQDNKNVADDFRNWLKDHTAEAGGDLVNFFNDPEFLEALETQEFYKQDFDDAFQEAVILGYKSERDSGKRERPTFVRIRFPASLATALRFQPVASIGRSSSR
jgi:hypothetical protein